MSEAEGRDLDIATAKAMGWRAVNPVNPETRRVTKKHWELVSPLGVFTGWHRSESDAWSVSPRLTTSSEGLVIMLEWAAAQGWTPTVEGVIGKPGEWISVLYVRGPDEVPVGRHGSTPQEALARAIVAAKCPQISDSEGER